MEMMVIVAMLGALMAIGIPSFTSMLVNSELRDTTNDMIITLKRARFEAIKRGQTVRICSSADGFNCLGTPGTYFLGWLAFADADGNGQPDPEEIIWVKDMAPDTKNTFTINDPAYATFIDFNNNGMLVNDIDAEIVICSGVTNGYPRREILISVSGDVSLERNTSVKC